MNCTGNEKSLLNCRLKDRYDLRAFPSPLSVSFKDPLQVTCESSESSRGSPPCKSGSVRLGNSTNNGSRLEGRVEICVEGVWSTVCDHFKWSSNEARIVCMQLTDGQATGNVQFYCMDTMYRNR